MLELYAAERPKQLARAFLRWRKQKDGAAE
jgi:hypothetical protein